MRLKDHEYIADDYLIADNTAWPGYRDTSGGRLIFMCFCQCKSETQRLLA